MLHVLIFFKAEMLFHHIQDSLWDKQNVSHCVIQAIEESIKCDLELPNCYEIKQKLVKRFGNFRFKYMPKKRGKALRKIKVMALKVYV